MNKLKLLAVAVSSVLVSGALQASSKGDVYTGVQLALGSYSEDGFDTVSPTGIIGKYGKYINDDFAIEGRFGIGLQDDSVDVFGVEVSVELDILLGVYGVSHVNVSPTTSVYGMFGFSNIGATFSAPGFGSGSETESGLSFGVGVNIGSSKAMSFNIEYVQYLSKSEFDFSVIGLGARFSL